MGSNNPFVIAVFAALAVCFFLFGSKSPQPRTSVSLAETPQLQAVREVHVTSANSMVKEMYLRLLRDALVGLIYPASEKSITPSFDADVSLRALDKQARVVGEDWPHLGLTMTGVRRLDFLRGALENVMAQSIPGDFVECGVWRGGSSIFAAGCLAANGDQARRVFVVDSFQGLPKARSSNDHNEWSKQKYLMVSEEEVRANFEAFNLLTPRVIFAKGFFKDVLPSLKVDIISVLRLDGDMYESTMDELFNLYEKVSVGGYVIIDDWSIEPCQRAINQFREWHSMDEDISPIDKASAFWIKQKVVKVRRELYNF